MKRATMHKYFVVYNPKSGSGSDKAALQAVMTGAGLEASYQGIGPNLERDVARAVKEGATVLVAAGGDGTVSALSGLAVKHDVTLGVLPAGTLNHFAKDIAVGDTLEAAAATLARGNVQKLDVAEVNSQVFVNNSSIGLYPSLVRERERLQKYITKWPAMVVAFLIVLTQIRRHRIMATIDGDKQLIKASFMFIGNNRYKIEQGDFSTRHSLQEGVLSVYVLKTAKFRKLLRVAWNGLRGQLAAETAFDIYEAREVTLQLRYKRVFIAFDGEVRREQPKLRYILRPAAMKVVVK